MGFLAIDMVPAVSDQINAQHLDSILNIQDEIFEANSPNLSPVCVSNTITGIPSEMKTSGLSYVISPDGQIIRSFKNYGYFSSAKAGTYSLIVYPASNMSFIDPEFAAIRVSKPSITSDISYSTHDQDLMINISIKILSQ